MVYLTTAYAPYFAMMAEGEGNPVVLEIDPALLRQDLFYPDEDFVAQAIREKTGLPLSEIHEQVKQSLEDYQEFAAASLAALGNAAYKGTIPASAIVRACVISPDQQPASMMTACDPCISPLNYRFVGEKYRSLTAWLFGDRPDWDLGYGDNEQYLEFLDRANCGDSNTMRQAFSNRRGITVRTFGAAS